MPDLSGQSIGRYHLIAPLGEGGMATVYKAFDTRLESDVAIKFIRKENILSNQMERVIVRFEREAKRMAKFTHPNIVKVMDYGEYEGSPYLVMEYLPGGTLKDVLKGRTGKPIPYLEAVRILTPIARALDYAHKQDTIHRDIKPANILLTDEGFPMLTDFGVAKILDLDEGNTLTGTGVGVGTPKYMAPEQWQNHISVQTDVYALGVVLYEMITGKVPFDADTPAGVLTKQLTEPLGRPKQFVPGLPEEVERVIYKALAKEPQDRYADMATFAGALERLAQGANEGIFEKHSAPTAEYGLPGGDTGRVTIQPSRPQSTPLSNWEESRTIDGQAGGSVAEAWTPAAVRVEKKEGSKAVVLWGVGAAALLAVIVLLYGALKPPDVHAGVMQTQTAMVAAQTGVAGTQTALARETPTARGQASGEENYPTVTKTPTVTDTPPVTPTPQKGETRTSNKDGMVSIYIPAGEFLMGSPDGDSDEKPQHTVYLDGYWMDKTEVTNAMYQKCVSDGGCKEPYSKSSNTHNDYYGNAAYSDYPVIYVDWNQAKGYCAWAGGRLPTEAEWEKAARGTDGRKYPWGNEDATCELANYGGKNNGKDYCVGDTTEVGGYPSGASPYGIMDMAGNVWEWVNDWYDSGYYQNSPPKNPSGPGSGSVRVVRGGSWISVSWYVRAANRLGYGPVIRGDASGFRCVRLP